MKSIFHFFVLFAFVCAVIQPAWSGGPERDIVFQVAPIQSLCVGVYDGFISFAALKKNGDIGLGTFDALDGEMIFVDNVFYQVKQDGHVRPVPDSALTPFAVVTFFDEELRLEAVNAADLAGLARAIDSRLPTKNLFYAVRIDGDFEYVKLRSVPAQTKPYPSLTEAVKGQTVFEYKNISGTLVGFRSPAFAGKINVPGYHFHFLAADRLSGGHVLNLRFKGLAVRLDQCSALMLVMPESGGYFGAELDGDEHRDLKKNE